MAHGLPPERYGARALTDAVDAYDADPTTIAANRLEETLSAAFVAYARDLVSGAVDPESLESGVYVDPVRPNPEGLLAAGLRARDFEDFLVRLAPTIPRYERLQQAVATLGEQVARGGWGAALPERGLSPGSVSRNVARLRRKLIATGDLPPEPENAIGVQDAGATTGVAAYDTRLEGAVARFQERHGLTADGIAGPATMRALNVPIEKRLAQAMLNLERLRWRRDRLSGRRIEVNLADFRMSVFDERGAPVHDARVIVGQDEARLQTPEFFDYMSYIVLNPRWTVPNSIIRREMLPELQKDAGYIERNNMVMFRSGKRIKPEDVDWSTKSRSDMGAYSVVQKPGPGNALGAVKFMFPNGYNIYLHDTPTKHLFGSEKRTYSHGCVRVERPFALAWLLLSEQSDDPGGLIEQKLGTGKEETVPLDAPIPINLLYLTAWVDASGAMHFRDDVYGRDAKLARAIYQTSRDSDERGH